MLPSLFSESVGSPQTSQTEKDTRKPPPEVTIDFSKFNFYGRYRPNRYRGPSLYFSNPKFWTENSDDDINEDDERAELPIEEMMTLMNDHKKRYFAEKRRHDRDWRNLKMDGIPTDEDDLDAWVEDWKNLYIESLYFCMFPRCSVKEKKDQTTFDLLEAIFRGGAPYDKFCSLYTPFLNRREGLDEFNFRFILGKFQYLWHLLNKDTDSDSERRCVCPFNNHDKGSDCFYLNEQIRPKNWKPNRRIMDKLKRQAQNDKVLASFIERHKKGQPKPREIEDKNFDPHQIHAIFPITLEDDSWKLRKIRNSFLMLDTAYHICRDYERFHNFVPVYPYLPENKLNSIGPNIETLNVDGIGDVVIQATTVDGKKKGRRITLFNVRYCPMAPCNAISIPRCESSNIHWDKRTQILYEEKDGMRTDIAKIEKHFGFNTLEYKPFHEPKKDI
ncbi:hypothetical protein ZTR_05599 [Talaromyces verruculosus]|nr:hypothetical protein ZTR_05599 [Talaromyces verruculosus]